MRFICDAMLGKLAKYLRILGFDTVYMKNISRSHIDTTVADPVYILTRNRTFTGLQKTVVLKSNDIMGQLGELTELIKTCIEVDQIMSRCIVCNAKLADVHKSDIEQRVPEFIFHLHEEFKTCPKCNRVYWEGSHAEHMTGRVEEIMGIRLRKRQKKEKPESSKDGR